MQRPGAADFSLQRRDFLISLGLFAIVVALFWPARNFAYLSYDDTLYIFDNPHAVQGLSRGSIHWAITSLVLGNYMPVPVLSLLADVSLFGLKPGPFHLENVLLHAFSTVGWYLTWAMLTGRRGRSFMVAALFGLHPMHVEPVAWISTRGDLLAMPLLLASLLAYLRFVKTGHRRFYVLSLIIFPVALLAKTVAMTFPALLLVLNVWPLRRFHPVEKSPSALPVSKIAAELTPFALLGIAGAALGFFTRLSSKASIPFAEWGVADRCATVVIGYCRYLGKAFWPEPMLMLYPLRRTYTAAMVVAAAVLLILLTVAAWRARRRRPYLIVGWLWFLLTLAPTIGVVQSGPQSIADRYTYLPYVGLSVAVVWGFADFFAGLASRWMTMSRLLSAVKCGIALILCSLDARRQLYYWRDNYALYSHTAQFEPDDPIILVAMLTEHQHAGQFDLALQDGFRYVNIKPNDPAGHTRLAWMLMKIDARQALPQFQAAARLAPLQANTWWDLGQCQQQLNDTFDATRSFRQALRLDPSFELARQSLKAMPPAANRDE